MRVLCTICARKNSKGVKNKNIKKINGKPLLKYTMEHAVKSKIFEDIIVSSDSKTIIKMAKSYGATLSIERPKKLASDRAGKLESIQHALISAEKISSKKYDIIIDLDVSSPLRLVSDIQNSFKLFLNKKSSILMSATPSRKNPYFNQVIQNKKKVQLVIPNNKYFSRQKAPKIFDLNASIYIYQRSILLKTNTIYTNKSILYIMPEDRSIDIDSINDFKYVEYILKKRKKNE